MTAKHERDSNGRRDFNEPSWQFWHLQVSICLLKNSLSQAYNAGQRHKNKSPGVQKRSLLPLALSSRLRCKADSFLSSVGCFVEECMELLYRFAVRRSLNDCSSGFATKY
eukprot:569984-Amphidinium_carterae.1